MNKSSSYSKLSITVTAINNYTVTYTLAHTRNSRPFNWTATLGRDRMTVDQLEVGSTYWISVEPDKYGTQHWIDARLVEQRAPKPQVPAIRLKSQVHADLLVW